MKVNFGIVFDILYPASIQIGLAIAAFARFIFYRTTIGSWLLLIGFLFLVASFSEQVRSTVLIALVVVLIFKLTPPVTKAEQIAISTRARLLELERALKPQDYAIVYPAPPISEPVVLDDDEITRPVGSAQRD